MASFSCLLATKDAQETYAIIEELGGYEALDIWRWVVDGKSLIVPWYICHCVWLVLSLH